MNENEGVHVREARHCLLCGCEGALLYAGLGTSFSMRRAVGGSCGVKNVSWSGSIRSQSRKTLEGFMLNISPIGRWMLRPGPWQAFARGVKASILQSRFGFQMGG